MPHIHWHRHDWQGWYGDDAEGNRWHISADRHFVLVQTPEGWRGRGRSEREAWNALYEAA